MGNMHLRFYDNPNVPSSIGGDSHDKGYEGWIDLLRLSFTSQSGLSLTKNIDRASPGLQRMSADGTARIAVIHVVFQGDLYSFTMPNAMVASFKIAHDEKQNLSESVTLSYDKITYNILDKAPDVTNAKQRDLWRVQSDEDQTAF